MSGKVQTAATIYRSLHTAWLALAHNGGETNSPERQKHAAAKRKWVKFERSEFRRMLDFAPNIIDFVPDNEDPSPRFADGLVEVHRERVRRKYLKRIDGPHPYLEALLKENP